MLNFTGEAAGGQTKNSKKTTAPATKKSAAKAAPKPAPESKAKSAKATAKPTPPPQKSSAKSKSNAPPPGVQKSKKQIAPAAKKNDASKTTPKPSPKTADGEQIIVVATDARIRQQPKTSAPPLNVIKIGKLLPVTEKNGNWYRVEYENDRRGWLSSAVARNFDGDNRDEIYTDIADRYAKNKSLGFAAAAEVSDFLRTAQALAKKDAAKAELGFKRLQVLAAAMRAVPSGKGNAFPYKNFIQSHEKEVVFSEPSGTWLVRSDLFWELHNKYTQSAIAEDIAWAAARNAIPGECEGYINCRLYALRAMEGEYLNFYPSGKYARQALELVTANLGVMVAEMNSKATFSPLADISDRAEFNRFLTELRTIISKASDADKAKPLQHINLLGEGYK